MLEGTARRRDLAERARAFRAAFPDWRAPWSAETFAEFADDPQILWLEARLRTCSAADVFAGLLLARLIEPEVEILTLFRAPGESPQGVGAALIERLILHFTERKIDQIFLEVSVENVRALRLYERFRFEQVGLRPGYYRTVSGRTQDAVILRYDFSALR